MSLARPTLEVACETRKSGARQQKPVAYYSRRIPVKRDKAFVIAFVYSPAGLVHRLGFVKFFS